MCNKDCRFFFSDQKDGLWTYTCETYENGITKDGQGGGFIP